MPISHTTGEFLSNFKGGFSKSDIYAVKIMSDISLMLIKNRINMGMNQKEFAQFLGVSQGMVSKWERGTYNFTIQAIADLCEKIGYTVDVVLEDEKSKNRKTYITKYGTTKSSYNEWGNLVDMSNKSNWAGAA